MQLKSKGFAPAINSHTPLQDVVSDRLVHTSWALFVPGMWSPSNQTQQLSLCKGKRRFGETQGGAGTASILLLPYHLSCSEHLHTKTPQ